MLAGGASRRFGGIAKGLQVVGGRRMIDHVAEALRMVTPKLAVASNDPVALRWLPGVAVLPDRFPDVGGLAGLDAALGTGNDVLIVAWDMPFVTADLLALILAEARNHDADAVVPASGSPHGFEPYCSFYSARVAEALEGFLSRGNAAPSQFLAGLARVIRMPVDAVTRVGDPARLFLSVNSPQDLAQARALAGDAQ